MENFKISPYRRYFYLIIVIVGIAVLGCQEKPRNSYSKKDNSEIKVFGTMEAELTAPPYVPAPVGNRPAMKL